MGPIRPIVTPNQDMPPPGGYPKLNFNRGLRNRGPSGLVIWSVWAVAFVWGLSQVRHLIVTMLLTIVHV